ncbi:hypothetical protein LCGC14_2695470, partial [marine sediment metagenome]
MLLKEVAARADKILERITHGMKLYPSNFLPVRSQVMVQISRLEIPVEVAFDVHEIDGLTDNEIEVFLRKRLADNFISSVNPVYDAITEPGDNS